MKNSALSTVYQTQTIQNLMKLSMTSNEYEMLIILLYINDEIKPQELD